jgi:hypothetical protein
VIIQTDPLGSNTTVYVNPTNSNLAGQSPYLVAAPVGTLTGTTPALTVGAVMMSQFGSGSSQTPAVGVSKMCVSTNYGTVYNSLLGTPADPFTTWQNQYFGGTTGNAVAGADPDGDGMSNTNEFLAGFNPTNNAASLRITSATRSGNDIRVTYRGANGNGTTTPPITSRTNVLEFTAGTADRSYSNNFVSTGLTNVLSGGDGSGVVTNFLDVGAAASSTSRYYRVRVIVP